MYKVRLCAFFLFGLVASWGQSHGPKVQSPRAAMLVLRPDCSPDCSTAALTTPQKILSISRLVELKMLDFSDRSRTGISILTSAVFVVRGSSSWWYIKFVGYGSLIFLEKKTYLQMGKKCSRKKKITGS